jgi:hypothetical protein
MATPRLPRRDDVEGVIGEEKSNERGDVGVHESTEGGRFFGISIFILNPFLWRSDGVTGVRGRGFPDKDEEVPKVRGGVGIEWGVVGGT